MSRASMLAKIQAEIVGKQLENCLPELEIEYHTSTTIADRDMEINIAESDSVGLFTKDISDKLINKKFDIAVHSWKDVPVEPSTKTEIIGTVNRGDMRDVLIIKKDIAKNKKKEVFQILSSSPRRKHNLALYLPRLVPFNFDHLRFLDVRGNIETRLRKFVQGDSDAIVMAKVAIDRILESNDNKAIEFIKNIISKNKWIILPLSIFPTAPGQGAIGIEARKDRKDLKTIINKITNKIVFDNVLKEKNILNKYGGGCQQKIGVSIYSQNGRTIFSMKGKTEQGDDINKHDFFNRGSDKNCKNIPQKLLYPLQDDKNLFQRVQIFNNEKISKLTDSFIYISRKNVLDNVHELKNSNYLWTSGLKCWYHAVKKGYWINGTSDSMGNHKLKDLKNFVSEQIPRFNLSHTKATSNNDELIPTYELKVNDNVLDNLSIEGKKYFYWMSPVQFEVVVERYPEILNAKHSSGFGKTFDYLKTKLPNPSAIECFLSYEHWLSYYKKRE